MAAAPETDLAGAAAPVGGPRPGRLSKLSNRESLRLLASVSLGRVVFTIGALPAVRPVNHVLVDDDIIVMTHLGSGLSDTARVNRGAVVVAYEADEFDPVTRTGWSVVATGIARIVTDPADVARYAAVLRPWIDQPMDRLVRIRPELVTGYRLEPADPTAGR